MASLPDTLRWKPCGRCANYVQVNAVQYDVVRTTEGEVEELIRDLDRKITVLSEQSIALRAKLDMQERLRDAAAITLEALRERRR